MQHVLSLGRCAIFPGIYLNVRCLCWMEVLNWLLNVRVLFSYLRVQKHFSPIKYCNPWQASYILEIRLLEMCRPTVFQNDSFSNFANCIALNNHLFQVHIRYCTCNYNKLPLERYLTILPIDKIFSGNQTSKFSLLVNNPQVPAIYRVHVSALNGPFSRSIRHKEKLQRFSATCNIARLYIVSVTAELSIGGMISTGENRRPRK